MLFQIIDKATNCLSFSQTHFFFVNGRKNLQQLYHYLRKPPKLWSWKADIIENHFKKNLPKMTVPGAPLYISNHYLIKQWIMPAFYSTTFSDTVSRILWESKNAVSLTAFFGGYWVFVTVFIASNTQGRLRRSKMVMSRMGTKVRHTTTTPTIIHME